MHVHSHSGVLGNEIADVLSKHAAKQWHSYSDRCLPTWPAKLVAHALHPWAWMLLDSTPELPTLFALPAEADRLQRRAQPIMAPPEAPVQRGHNPGELRLDIQLMTFNVLTLLDSAHAVTGQGTGHEQGGAGFRLFGKRDLIKRQLEEYGLHVVGLQETRVAGNQVLADGQWWMLHAGCTNEGRLGTALWIHKHKPFVSVNGRPHCIAREDLTVLHASPRLLVVDISCRAFRLVCVVAHAPHDMQQEDEARSEAFWNTLSAILKPLPPTVSVVMLADANSHVGNICTSSIGDVEPECENVAGRCFHTWLLHHDLSAANMFRQCHSGPSFTWTSARGTHRRLDYICIPSAWLSAVSTATSVHACRCASAHC